MSSDNLQSSSNAGHLNQDEEPYYDEKLKQNDLSFQQSQPDPITEKKLSYYIRQSRSPEQSAYVIEDLRNTLKQTYENELERFLFQQEAAQKREEELVQNRSKLHQQLNFWSSKARQAQQSQINEQNYNQDLTDEQLRAFEQSQNLQIQVLDLEKEKLSNALNERKKQADEWQHKAAEFEERFLTNNRIQFELQSYEKRIQRAIDQNADKAREYEDLQMHLARLQLTNADILKLEEDLNTQKELVDFKHKEGLDLKAHIEALQLEDSKGKFLTSKLFDNQKRLLAQIELLKNNLAGVIAAKENQLKNTQLKNEAIINAQKHNQDNEKQNLNTHQRVLESNIQNRVDDINNFRVHNSNLDIDLRNTIQAERNLSLEAEKERIRHDSAEIEKRRNIEIENSLKNNTIDKLNREQAFQRSVLQGKLNSLSNTINNKSVDVAKTKDQLRQTEQEKIRKQIEKNELEKRLQDWTIRFNLTQQAQNQDLVNKEIAQRRHFEAVQTASKIEQNNLANVSNNLNNVYDINRRNHELQLQRVNHFQNRLLETQIKERQTSAEAEAWKNKTAEIERSKNLELDLSIQRKRREIDSLRNSQHFERELALQKKVEILNLLNHQERENNHIKYDNIRSANQYHSNSAEKIAALNNANRFQNYHDINVHQTLNDSIVQDNVTRNTLNHINVVRNTEKNLIQRDIHNLSSSAAIHKNDAINYRIATNNNLLLSRYPSVMYY